MLQTFSMRWTDTFKCITCSAALAATLLMSACTTSPDTAKLEVDNSYQAAAPVIPQIVEQIDLTLASLDALLNDPMENPAEQFDSFREKVGQLQQLTRQLSMTSDQLQRDGDNTFTLWTQPVANNDSQATSDNQPPENQEALLNRFQIIQTSYVQAQSAVQPLMSTLEDIRSMLQADLSPGTLEAMKTHAAKADAQSLLLVSVLKRLQKQYELFTSGL